MSPTSETSMARALKTLLIGIVVCSGLFLVAIGLAIGTFISRLI